MKRQFEMSGLQTETSALLNAVETEAISGTQGTVVIKNQTEPVVLRDGRTVVLRQASPSDFDAILQYVTLLTQETIVSEQYPGRLLQSKAQLEQDCDNQNALFVLADNEKNEVVGMLSARLIVPDNLWEKTNCRFFVHLLKSYQGFGLGTKLMHLLEQWARHKGAQQIEETIRHTSIQSFSLYLKQGFRIENSERDVACINGEWYHEYKIAKAL